jgi:DNA-binding transcriptional LysR family regulator
MGVAMDWIDRIGRRVKLRDLHILLAVTQSGSMGRAAAEMSVSQPVVSKAVSELESALGARLFDRSPQGISPTAYGRAMIQCSRAVFDELQKGVKAIEFLSDPTGGELRIGCTEMGATGLVPLVIERLAERHPGLEFRVITADPVSLTTDELPRRNIELAIGAMPASPPADIEIERLFEDHQVIMAGVNSPWVRRRKLMLADLLHEQWVLPPADSPARRYIDGAFLALGLEPPTAQVATFSTPLCHQLLATGRYLAFLPREAVRLARHLPVKPLRVEFPGIARTVGIMTLKNRSLSPCARLFIECARTTAAGLSPSDR